MEQEIISAGAVAAILTLPAIDAWLAPMPADAIVGACQDPFNCLVARHIKSAFPGTHVTVKPVTGGYGSVRLSSGGWCEIREVRETLPRAINVLALRFDDLHANSKQPVTAAEALALVRALIAAQAGQ